MRRLVLVGLAVAVLAPAVATRPAAAAPPVRRTLGADHRLDARAFPGGRKLVSLPPVHLRAGENRLVFGRLRARSRSYRNIGQLVGIECGGRPGGTVVTTRNNEGRDRAYREGPGVLSLRVRYLLVAERTGRYTCSLWGAALHPGPLTALGRGGGTFIEMRTESLPAAVQEFPERCAATGNDPGCTYLVPASTPQVGTGYPSSAFVLESVRYASEDGAALDRAEQAERAARSVDAAEGRRVNEAVASALAPAARRSPVIVDYMAGLQLTTCYRDTGSCADLADRYGDFEGSVVETRVEVLQGSLAVRGAAVAFHAARSTGNAAAVCPVRWVGRPVRTLITNDAHHQKVQHVHRHRIWPTGCGRDLLVRLHVRVLSGNPVKIEAGPVPYVDGAHAALGTAWYSSAITALR